MRDLVSKTLLVDRLGREFPTTGIELIAPVVSARRRPGWSRLS
jgi:hypothetical protein